MEPDSKTTLPKMWHHLCGKPSPELSRCVICGRADIDRHHVPPRSAGRLFVGGKEVPKPTMPLCGLGNNLHDADGRLNHHGMAHHGMLHFDWDGAWVYLLTESPVTRQEALGMDGWRYV